MAPAEEKPIPAPPAVTPTTGTPTDPAGRRARRRLDFILFCGLAPVLAGTAVFAWWWTTRSDAAATAGVYVVTAGTALVALGSAALVLRALIHPRPPLGRLLARGGLLVASVVAAYVYSELVIREITTYLFTFENASGGPVASLYVIHGSEGDSSSEIVGYADELPTGTTKTFQFRPHGQVEMGMRFSARPSGQEVGGSLGIVAYKTTKSHVRVVLQPNARYEVFVQHFSAGRKIGKELKVDVGGEAGSEAVRSSGSERR